MALPGHRGGEMRLLTVDARLRCEHGGRVVLRPPEQGWVRIAGRPVLVERDPEGCGIRGCPHANPPAGIRPCLKTERVMEGYSDLVRVGGRRVCLEAVTGLTDGTPPGSVAYTVSEPGQPFVREAP